MTIPNIATFDHGTNGGEQVYGKFFPQMQTPPKDLKSPN